MDLTSGATWGWLYVASEWIIRAVMLVVVPFRRSPEAAKGWLLAAFILPWPALVVYFLIGRPKLPAWRAARFARLPEIFAPTRRRLDHLPQLAPPDLPANLHQAADLVDNLGHLSPYGGNALEYLPDYQQSIDRLVADIDAARSHVHLLYYIFADDATGQKVIDALARARQRGALCRVIVDALGTRRWLKSLDARLAVAGALVRHALPVKILRFRSTRADLRNHRKIAVIDGRIGYTGSQNLIDATFKPGITYQEMVVRVQGPVVLQLQATFSADWFLETEQSLDGPLVFPEPDLAGPTVAQLLPSGPDYPTTNVQQLIVAVIHGALRRVVITTPYFIPDDALMEAMYTAALRGVEVHLIVSKLRDQVLVSLAQRSYYTELLQKGVRVHLFEGFLHAKHVSVDESLALIGSSNIDIRSFVLNSEVTLVVYGADATLPLRVEEERNIANSEPLQLDAWERRPLVAKVAENLARLVSPLL